MISSCNECTTKCCRSGPGPYKKISVHQWLYQAQGSNKYNKACEHYDEMLGLCKEWNTGNAPILCKTYVCGIRTYTKEELRDIDKLLKLAGKI